MRYSCHDVLDFRLLFGFLSFHSLSFKSIKHFWRINSFATKRWLHSEILWAFARKQGEKKPDVNQQHTKCWKQWKQKTITNAYFITARCLVYSLACEAIHRFSLLGLLYSFRFNAYKYIFCLFHFKKNIVCFFAHFMTSFECYNQSSHLIWAAHLGNFF